MTFYKCSDTDAEAMSNQNYGIQLAFGFSIATATMTTTTGPKTVTAFRETISQVFDEFFSFIQEDLFSIPTAKVIGCALKI